MEPATASTAILLSDLNQQSVTAQSGIPSVKPRVLRRSSRSTSSHTASSSAGQEEARAWNQDESSPMLKRKSPVKRHQRKRPYSVALAITGSSRSSDGGMLSQSKRAGRSQKTGPTRSKIAHDRESRPQDDQERASPPSMIGPASVGGILCPSASQSLCLHEDWSGRQPLLMDIVLDMKDYARTQANFPQANTCYWCQHLCLHEDPSTQHVVQRSGAGTFAYGYASHYGFGTAHPVSICDSSISVNWPGNFVLCAGMNQQVSQRCCQLQQLQTSYCLYDDADGGTPCNLGTRFPESGERSTVRWDSSSNSSQGSAHSSPFMG